MKLNSQVMRGSGLAMSVLLFAACGAPEVTEEDVQAAEEFVAAVEADMESGRTMADGAGDRPMNAIESFTFSQSGDVETAHEFDIDKLSLTGGCLVGEGMGFMFSDNSSAREPTFFMFAIENGTSPAPGQTGNFPIEKIRWANGNMPHPEFEGIRVPNMFEGSGQLTIKEHKGGGMNGRMVATVTGDLVEKDSSDKASVKVDYDIYWGCKD